MTIDRAIEILNPTTEGQYAPWEWLEAHRMACQALELLRWKDAGKEKPQAEDEYVLAVCSAQAFGQEWLNNDICIAEYDELLDEWTLPDDEDATPVKVSHWMRLPTLPEGVEA